MIRLLRQHARRWHVAMIAGETLLLVGAVFAAIALRFVGDPDAVLDGDYASVSVELLRAAVFAAALLLGMTALGLYQRRLRESWFGIFARQAAAFVIGWIVLVAVYYLLPVLSIGRGVLALALLVAFVALLAARWLVSKLVDVETLKRRVLILGGGWRAASIIERLRRSADRRGFVIVGFVAQAGEEVEVPAASLVPMDGPLSAWTPGKKIDEILVALNDRRGQLPLHELLACRQQGIDITDLSTFFEREAGFVPLLLTDPSWLVFASGFDASPLRQVSKRCFDVVMAIGVALLCSPLLVLTALAVGLESGRPLLYRQQRVGEGGRCFELIKFRSMRTDAEGDGVARWARENDARVTRVGRILRKVRLDELPQLWNVLRGDMSFIGPRPERPEFVADLVKQIPFYDLRHAVKPGLAGWAQLRYPYGASVEDAGEKLKYDLYYVKNHNAVFDFMILIQTVEVVLFGHGAR